MKFQCLILILSSVFFISSVTTAAESCRQVFSRESSQQALGGNSQDMVSLLKKIKDRGEAATKEEITQLNKMAAESLKKNNVTYFMRNVDGMLVFDIVPDKNGSQLNKLAFGVLKTLKVQISFSPHWLSKMGSNAFYSRSLSTLFLSASEVQAGGITKNSAFVHEARHAFHDKRIKSRSNYDSLLNARIEIGEITDQHAENAAYRTGFSFDELLAFSQQLGGKSKEVLLSLQKWAEAFKEREHIQKQIDMIENNQKEFRAKILDSEGKKDALIARQSELKDLRAKAIKEQGLSFWGLLVDELNLVHFNGQESESFLSKAELQERIDQIDADLFLSQITLGVLDRDIKSYQKLIEDLESTKPAPSKSQPLDHYFSDYDRAIIISIRNLSKVMEKILGDYNSSLFKATVSLSKVVGEFYRIEVESDPEQGGENILIEISAPKVGIRRYVTSVTMGKNVLTETLVLDEYINLPESQHAEYILKKLQEKILAQYSLAVEVQSITLKIDTEMPTQATDVSKVYAKIKRLRKVILEGVYRDLRGKK